MHELEIKPKNEKIASRIGSIFIALLSLHKFLKNSYKLDNIKPAY